MPKNAAKKEAKPVNDDNSSKSGDMEMGGDDNSDASSVIKSVVGQS